MIILIPAYEPDVRLINLVTSMRAPGPRGAASAPHIVIVDDGSGPAFRSIFDRVAVLGATVLRHRVNRGKGAALKTGFAHIAEYYPDADVVCADCDGQHTARDILRVAAAIGADSSSDGSMVLGSRSFTGPVPLRSRFGNTLTRGLFTLSTGQRVADTQTGLRGYPAKLLPWLLRVPGERFEYELNALLHARGAGYAIGEVPIETVYLDGNASSHFRPVVDSARIYAPLLRFAASSLLAFTADSLALFALMSMTGNLAGSVIGARLFSGTLNYLTNRRLVFRAPAHAERPGIRQSATRYATLAVALLTANYLMLALFFGVVGLPLVVAKVLTEVTLFGTSYAVQRRVVFARQATDSKTCIPRQ